MYYKFTKNGTHFFEKHASLEAAQTRANELGGYTVEEAPQMQDPIKTPEQQVLEDIEFGKSLVFQFLVDEKGKANTAEQSLAIQAKLKDVSMLLEKGAILAAYALLQAVIVDDLFTQQTKDKYLALIANYIS